MDPPRLKRSKPYDPKRMSAAEKEQLTDTLFGIHSRIFDGVDREAFRKYVVDPPTESTSIWLFLAPDGSPAGYITFQVYGLRPGTKRIDVFRTELGLLPEYRGRNTVMPLLLRQVLRRLFKTGFRRAYFVATHIHPSPYYITASQVWEMYPTFRCETPGAILEIMDLLSAALGLKKRAGGGRFERLVGWRVKPEKQKAPDPKKAERPDVKFFLSENPDYMQGVGLMILIPMGFRNMFWSMLNMMRRRKIHRFNAGK